MTPLDWTIVVLLNGSVILYAIWKGRDADSPQVWFLAGRSLPWWLVGLSLYATAIDSTDIVVDSGATYRFGLRFFTFNCLGVVAGWLMMAHFILPVMYRTGMYTNAEYLEHRFGVTARIISVIVQVLYRTTVIGMIGTANFLVLTIICDWNATFSWGVVITIASLASLYTAIGGLKSVVITDALQSVVMIVASLVIFVLIWNECGGWDGISSRLAAQDPALPDQLLRVGSDDIATTSTEGMRPEQIEHQLAIGGSFHEARSEIIRRTPGWLVCLSFTLGGVAYAIVNHTQSMRLLGSRSILDSQWAAVFGGMIIILATVVNLTLGVMGRAIYAEIELLPVSPTLQRIDSIFPILVRDFVPVGLKGIVVAGILSASFSTYDSIGSTLSALLTRDIYMRLFASDKSDSHYVMIGRILTPIVILGSFAYVPMLLTDGMIFFYLDIVSTFVIPLMTVYLLGRFTPVHPRSGTVGLICGSAFGVLVLLTPYSVDTFGVSLVPAALLNGFLQAPLSVLATALTMLSVTLFYGRHMDSDTSHIEPETARSIPVIAASVLLMIFSTWLTLFLMW